MSRLKKLLFRASIAIIVLVVVVGVATIFVEPAYRNEPLKAWDPEVGYRHTFAWDQYVEGSDDMLFAIAFSGGGTRAAAFGYGVLEELRDTTISIDGEQRRLLDEVDWVSGVSGGSFIAAYYSLYGDRIFEDFEERFLKRDVRKDLIFELAKPTNWIRLLSARFNRSDLAAEFYDREIFGGGTFGDIERAGGKKAVINATDVSTGNPFFFVQDQFDFICSDLSSFPVGRAVAASAAVPVAFPPVTLRN
jgi:NTE family protein